MTQLYTSDNSSTGFDATTAGTLPSDWTAVAGAYQAITTTPLTGHTHSFGDTSQVDGQVALVTSPSATADMEITGAIFVPSGGVSGANVTSLGPICRSNSGATNYYLALLTDTTHMALYKFVSGTPTGLVTGTSLGFTIASGDTILFRMQTIGTTINARFWKSTSAEPGTWTATTTDSSVSAAGYAGVYNAQGVAAKQAVLSDFNVDSVASSSNQVLPLAPTQITPSGGNITVSGVYAGTAPSALDVSVDGSSFSAASSPTIGGGTFSFAMTAPATGYHALDVRDHNNTTHTSSGVYDVLVGSTTIAANNTAFKYSPGNWKSGATAITINSGAYASILFNGTSPVLGFDVSNLGSPASEIWWRIDYSAWTKANVAATVSLTIPADTDGNTDIPFHLLEFVVKSTTETINRWDPASTGTAVKFTGLTISGAGTVTAPSTQAKLVYVYGDSIAEGVRAVGESASNDTDRNDALQSSLYLLRHTLGCEVGVIGFGGTGYTASGSGSVPALTSTYDHLYTGQTRSFSPAPDLVVLNLGANDGGASSGSITTAVTTVLNGLLAATPGTTKIAVLDPLPPSFTGASTVRSAIQTAISNVALARSAWVAATGVFDTTKGCDSSSIHPSGPNHQGLIAPQLAGLIAPYLYPSSGGGAPAPGGYVIGAS